MDDLIQKLAEATVKSTVAWSKSGTSSIGEYRRRLAEGGSCARKEFSDAIRPVLEPEPEPKPETLGTIVGGSMTIRDRKYRVHLIPVPE